MDDQYLSIKAVRLEDLPNEAWTTLGGVDGSEADARAIYRSVPWAFRAIEIISDAAAKVPFDIYRIGQDQPIDSSDDYEGVVPFLPDLKRLITQVASAMQVWNYAYLYKRKQLAGGTYSVRYILPTSITEVIDQDTGEVSFIRRIKGQDMRLTADDLVYIWGVDPYVESGRPKSSPLQAALNAGGVLLNVDKFATAFFQRGAIKGTLLAVSGNPTLAERDRIKSWWQRLFGGGSDTSWGNAVLNADAVTAIPVGEGLDSLENTALTEDKRIDIAAAFGIPYSVLFSNASNRATAETDDMHLYDKTVVPLVDLVLGAMNTQLLIPAGYRIKSRPQSMDVFQVDETKRSASVGTLVAAGVPVLTAMDILGYDLTDEQIAEIVQATLEKQARSEQMVQQLQPKSPRAEEDPDEGRGDMDDDQKAGAHWYHRDTSGSVDKVTIRSRDAMEQIGIRDEIRQYKRWRIKRLKGEPGNDTFEWHHAPPALAGTIEGMVEDLDDIGDLVGVIERVLNWESYP